MTHVRKIALSSAVFAAASFLSVAHAAASSATPFKEEVVRMGHGFELGYGENLTLAHHRKPVTYRVCIEEVPGVVPLKLDVDGKKMEVMDGTCADVVGAHISIKPAAELPHDRMMVGHFERVKK